MVQTTKEQPGKEQDEGAKKRPDRSVIYAALFVVALGVCLYVLFLSDMTFGGM